MNPKLRIRQHIHENRGQYFLISIIFLLGVVIGNYKVTGLEGEVTNYLLSLIDNYLQGGVAGNLDGNSILLGAFFNQARIVAAIWFLGLTVIGLPLILAVVFLRGFSLGFTVGFLYQEKAMTGILISLISVLPQNLVYIPFLIMWAVIALNFSIFIVKGRNTNVMLLGTGLMSYSILMLVFLLLFLLGAFIEAYLSPWLLTLFI
ncbi:MAG: stage II sporulation protein M [Syntrophomonadaceae bacterium]|nr:stage II sporulation protein M [Syntrophomonadaceae bacterium]